MCCLCKLFFNRTYFRKAFWSPAVVLNVLWKQNCIVLQHISEGDLRDTHDVTRPGVNSSSCSSHALNDRRYHPHINENPMSKNLNPFIIYSSRRPFKPV